ncbi:hypothetical protein [Sediminicurvatus halobius]|uniref:Uncharacterized protein n=1 Tax=Sediminicurvatus halobius TaxID=2182432 RepID=A0A2U2MYS0_9GAMM|nr:hypothetical protein [Spiribacter halobius]PWG61958.1 hypothetical protein DEM34_13930 [Spiribacter halobius]UEX78365.1 hypothetical protein LMH63_01605 [Spiribacter halobius]
MSTNSDDRKDQQPAADAHDPRPVSDDRLREEVTREQVERWRREADESHSNWFSVMNNPYGKD